MNKRTETELRECNMCPHNCGTDRFETAEGICGMKAEISVSSYGPHFGEEPELVGFGGSGTIFLAGCNLLCVFCQNYTISHYREGYDVSSEGLAEIMLRLQDTGCDNINFVTPTHFTYQIIEAIEIAKNNDLILPIVWNSNAYEKVDTLNLLEGLVDIYMPDLKFYHDPVSKRLVNAKDYFDHASRAVLEMYRQVGDIVIKRGIIKRGLLIRHLVLPENESHTKDIIDFIAEKIGTDVYLNIMDQYRPCYKASKFKEINSFVSPGIFNDHISYAKSKGFKKPDYLYE